MDNINLVKAWEQMEAQELLNEAKVKKPAAKLKGKVTAVGKGKETAVGKKKFEEDGGAAPGGGAGVGGNPAPTAGGTFTQSGNAAKFAARLGDKAKKKVGVKEDASSVKNDANRAAQQAVSDVRANRATDTDAKIVGSMVEEDPPLPPGADEIAADLGTEDPHAEGPEAAAVAHDKDPAGEEGAEDVSVDAETAEQVVDAIMKQYPGAVITISVQLPEETPFDTDLVAAAQEVVGADGGDMGGGDLGGEGDVDPNLDGVPPEAPEAAAGSPDDLMEKRKVIISKTRNQIKEMFARMSEVGSEVAPDVVPPEVNADAGEGIPQNDDDAAINAAAGEPVAPPEGEEAVVEPEVEVGDTKIALSPEQWGQVLATSDLLNGAGGEGELAPEAGAEGGEEVPPAGDEGLPAEGGVEAPAEEPIDELRTEVNLDGPDAKMQILKKVEKGDFKKDKKHDVAIKPAGMNESFNSELAGYADSLNKLLIKE